MTNRHNFDSIELMETTQASFDHLLRENPMGEARKDALRLGFDRRLRFEFHGTKVTSDAGLLGKLGVMPIRKSSCPAVILSSWGEAEGSGHRTRSLSQSQPRSFTPVRMTRRGARTNHDPYDSPCIRRT